MLLTLNKKSKKDALDIFKSILLYMGDKQTKSRDGNRIALEIGTLKSQGRAIASIPIFRITTYNHVADICSSTTFRAVGSTFGFHHPACF